jgi:hypothetical protein
MKNIYKNFVNYIDLATSGHFAHEYSSEKTKFELVKDNGEFLEYRFPIYSFNGSLVGHYYIGLHHTFKQRNPLQLNCPLSLTKYNG